MEAKSGNYQALAKRLREAYGRGPIPPLREGLAPADGVGAYEVQALNTKWWCEQGRRVVGRKIGLTAKTVQAQLGVSQPDFGVLFADMRIENGGSVSAAKLLQPKVEGEVALIFGRAVEDPRCTIADVKSAVELVAPAIEVVDSRIADWKITFADTVADNGSSGLFALGTEHAFRPGLDLWSCGMVLELNDEVVSLGAGAACLGHPLQAAHWLSRTLAERGNPIREGDIVLTGALGPMVAVRAGDRVRVSIGGLGFVEFTFTA
jgi:2-keto-4-pentenoate hydratase